ncbi:MAG TPA: ABC transporter permease, partial [Methylomirabilota bacterium]|nr:ABC transporter permease [Methylomirabilota bacterium]
MRLADLAWRGLRARPLRTVLAMLGIALGVAVVAATMIIGSASESALRSATADLLGRADVRLRAFDESGFTPRAIQALRAAPGVEVVAPVSERRLTAFTAPGPDERVFLLHVFGIDPEVDPLVRDPNLVAGVPLSVDSPTDALVSASWARRNGLELGDQIRLDGRRQGVPPLRIIGLMADTGFAALERGEVLVVSRTVLDESFSVPAPIRHLDLDLDLSGDDRASTLARATAQLNEPYIVETAEDAASRLAAAQDGFTGIAFLFGLLALVVGAFLVGNTLAMMVGERTRELGLLRAAGTTSRQVLGIVLRQALALGVIGSAAGVVAGVVLAAAAVAFLSSTRTVLVEGLPLPPVGLLLAFALGLLVTLAGALVPAMRAARLSPLDALHPSRRRDHGLTDRLRPLVATVVVIAAIGVLTVRVETGEIPLVPILLSLVLLVGGAVATAFVLAPLSRVIGRPFEWFFGAQGLLGRANLSRDRTRTGLTVGAMMIALAAVVALGAVAESARAGSERWVASILPGGYAIRATLPLDTEVFRETFETTDGLLAASPVLEMPAVRVTADGGLEETSVAGIDPNLFQDSGALIIGGVRRSDAFEALRAGGAVLVPVSLASRADIRVGDVISLGQPGT